VDLVAVAMEVAMPAVVTTAVILSLEPMSVSIPPAAVVNAKVNVLLLCLRVTPVVIVAMVSGPLGFFLLVVVVTNCVFAPVTNVPPAILLTLREMVLPILPDPSTLPPVL
jgi:hypothetical protein